MNCTWQSYEAPCLRLLISAPLLTSSLFNSQSSTKTAAQEVSLNNKDQTALLETAKGIWSTGVFVDAVFEKIKLRNEEYDKAVEAANNLANGIMNTLGNIVSTRV